MRGCVWQHVRYLTRMHTQSDVILFNVSLLSMMYVLHGPSLLLEHFCHVDSLLGLHLLSALPILLICVRGQRYSPACPCPPGHQSGREACFSDAPLTLDVWFHGLKHRALLTHSVEIRQRLRLGIRETIVTNKLRVAEWKLCILSQRSCRDIMVSDKFLGRVLAPLTGAPFLFKLNTK